jgi:DNA-directed RNA polymerase specialized sigma24 family protein
VPLDSPIPRRYVLDEQSLQRLLDAFDRDPMRASERYEALRQRLVRVFLWERQADAEALADETLDRVARKLGEGVALLDIAAYAHRCAELILLEARRRAHRRDLALEEHARRPAFSSDDSTDAIERRHACLDACLGRLDPEQRDLLLRYYSSDGRARIEQRDALAREYGIPVGALRNRALRLREKLEGWITECLSRQHSLPSSDTKE